jgi:hypothetical protein
MPTRSDLHYIRIKVQCCKIVVKGLCPSYTLHSPVGPEKQFLGPEPAVVIESHRIAMGPGIVDAEEILFPDHGKLPLDSELIVVFA